ncbi:MAG: prenyltransferase/squalene oxidase repeat-containing protein [Planctomycetota bacterium]
MKVFSEPAASGPRLGLVCPPSFAPDLPVVDSAAHFSVRQAVLAGREWLLSRQTGSGEFQAATRRSPVDVARRMLAARQTNATPKSADRLVDRLIDSQLPTGGWSVGDPCGRRGGAIDLGASLICYAAVKLYGGVESLPALRRARRAIQAAGGANAASGEALAWLVWLGQCDASDAWRSSAPRAVRDTLDNRPQAGLPATQGVRELFDVARPQPAASEQPWRLPPQAEWVWRRLAGREAPETTTPGADQRLASTCEAAMAITASGLEGDSAELNHATAWLSEAASRMMDASPVVDLAETLAAIRSIQDRVHADRELPPPLRLARLSVESPTPDCDAASTIDRLNHLLVSRQTVTGNWETQSTGAIATAVRALADSDSGRPAVPRAAAWLVDAQRADGSWPVRVAGGDEDNHAAITLATAEAVLALASCRSTVLEEPLVAGANWLMANAAPLDDESAADAASFAAAAKTLEALSATGFAAHSVAAEAADLLLDTQREDGAWSFGGAGDVSATAAAVAALAAWLPRVDEPTQRPTARRGVCLRLVGADRVVG